MPYRFRVCMVYAFVIVPLMQGHPFLSFLFVNTQGGGGGPRFHFRDDEEMYPFGTVCIQSLILLDMLGCEYVSKIGHIFAS